MMAIPGIRFTAVLNLALFVFVFFLRPEFSIGQVEGKIDSIRKKVYQLRNPVSDNYYVVKRVDIDYFAGREKMFEDSVELAGFFKNEEIKEIVFTIYTQGGWRNQIYFLSDEKLIFVLEQDISYSKEKISAQFGEVVKEIPVFEIGYFFDDKKIIGTEIVRQNRVEDDLEENKEEYFLNNYNEFIVALRKRK